MFVKSRLLRPMVQWAMGAILLVAACAPSSAAGPAYFYVSYSSGLVALDAETRTLIYGSVAGDVRNVLNSDNAAYWQDGRTIHRAAPNLFGAQVYYTAPEGFMPTDFAIDPAAGMFYVSFSSGLIALDTATRTLFYGSVAGNVTNVLSAGGSAYWQEGRNIYRAAPNLFGAQVYYTAPEGFTPTDFASAVPEPAAGWLMLAGGIVLIYAVRRRRRPAVQATELLRSLR